MAKREREEAAAAVEVAGAEPATKKAKKDKKEKKDKKRKEESNGGAESSEKKDKKEKKEKKRKEKEQEQEPADAEESGTDEAKAAAKAAKKAAKKAKKEAEQETVAGTAAAAGAAKDSDKKSKSAKTEANVAKDTVASPAAAQGGYTEHPKLSALPQSDIDKFIAEKFISVTDETNGSPVYRPMTSFDHLPIKDDALRAPLSAFSTPSPIQAAAWPYLFAGRDVVGVAETGSGKTMAFGVPCINYIVSLPPKDKKGIKACIVSPTRELALQIQEQLIKLATPAGLKVVCAYGGVNKDQQRETLRGAHIVVATPGRLNDFISEGSIDLSAVKYAVLDEADRMLDKGFEEEVRKILSSTSSSGRQTLMFTATWPPSVRDLAATFMKNPVKINIGENTTGELRANTRITQEVEVMDPRDKNDRLTAILKQYQSGKNKNDKILVFCLYKKEATRIEGFIRQRGFRVAGIHGDLSQQQRTASLDSFKKGEVPLLVATDVAARGLDIPAVKLVINVTFPLTVEDYVHRIGR